MDAVLLIHNEQFDNCGPAVLADRATKMALGQQQAVVQAGTVTQSLSQVMYANAL